MEQLTQQPVVSTTGPIKGIYGFEQLSTVHLFERWYLAFQTRVMSSGLSTRAYAYEQIGTQQVYRIFVDFDTPVLTERGGRYTKARVESQHAAALAQMDTIKDQAIAHTRKLLER